MEAFFINILMNSFTNYGLTSPQMPTFGTAKKEYSWEWIGTP